MSKRGLSATAAAIFASLSISGSAMANEYESQLRDIFQEQLKPWLSSPLLIDAINKQNTDHSGLTDADIDSMETLRE